MIKFALLPIALLASAANAATPKEQSLVVPAVDLRLFWGPPSLSAVVEVESRGELAERSYRSFRAGVVGTLLSRETWALKGGLSLWREYGALLESDWRKISDTWQWIPANDRASDSLSADLTPKYRINERLTADFRIRYQHGLSDDRRSFKLRPGLQWSVFRQGQPFLETFLQAEAYLSSVERASNPYEVWTYASVLWHAWNGALIGPKVAFRGSSLAGETPADGPYEVSNTTWSLGLVGVFTIR